MAKKKHAPILLGNKGDGWRAPHAPSNRTPSGVGSDAYTDPKNDRESDIVKNASMVTGMSNIQKLYMAGGVLDTASIVMGAMSAASAIRLKGKFEASAFMENSRRLKRAANDAKDRGEVDVANYLKGIKRLEGAQTAALAAQGIDVSRGTAKDIRDETIETGYEDMATIRTNAVREAFGFKKQAIEQEKSAKITHIARKSKETQNRLLMYSNLSQAVVSTGIKMNEAGTAGQKTGSK